jgi:quinol-cytochrome oxidoreductase complex cytochrome b subunit
VGGNITENVPLVGPFLKRLMLGGDGYNANTLSRFYIVHAALLPVTMVLLLVAHLALIRLHGVTELAFGDEREGAPTHFRLYPDHMITELAIGLVLMILLTSLAIVFPAEMGPKADPATTPEVIKPEWFFYVTFRWLKLMPGAAAILTMGFFVFVMILWPFVDARIRSRRPGSEASVWVGILAVLAITGMTVWEALVAH